MGADWYTFTASCGKGRVEEYGHPRGHYSYRLKDMKRDGEEWTGPLHPDADHDDECDSWLNVIFDDEPLMSSHCVMGCYDTSQFLRVSVTTKLPYVLVSLVM